MKKQVSAIITADIGLQEGQPICRTDSYWEAQAEKIKWLNDLQQQYGVPILDGGDLLEHWKSTPYLSQWAIRELPEAIVTTPGNHDLKAHSIELYDESGLAVLEHAGKVAVLKAGEFRNVPNFDFSVVGFPWGTDYTAFPRRLRGEREFKRRVALVHAMTYVGRIPFPGCKDPVALSMLKQMEGFDLIIVGHNHKPFIVEHEGRKLISPGSLTRTTADQADYKPCVYLWYAETNEIEAVPVPIREGVVTRNHIEIVERRDERMNAFVEHLTGEFEVGLSFERNIEEFFSANRVRKGVQDIVWQCVKGE